MPLSEVLNPGDYNADQVEKEIAAGGLIPIGRYHAALAKADEKPAGDNTKTELVFEILSGQYAGRKVRRDLFHNGNDPEKDKKAKNELLHFAQKLGVMVKKVGENSVNTYDFAPGMKDFIDAVGAECVLDVGHERWTRNDPTSDLTARVKMFGIHSLHDKEGTDCLNKLGLAPPEVPPPAPGPGDARAAKPQSGANGANSGANGATKHNGAPPANAGATTKKRFDTSKL